MKVVIEQVDNGYIMNNYGDSSKKVYTDISELFSEIFNIFENKESPKPSYSQEKFKSICHD